MQCFCFVDIMLLDILDSGDVMKKSLALFCFVVLLVATLTSCAHKCDCCECANSNESELVTYTATATLYANYYNKYEDSSISSSDLSAPVSLINTIEAILRSDATMETVIRQSGCSLSSDQLSKMLTIQSVDDTQVFNVSVTAEDQQLAVAIVNTIAAILPEKVASIIDNVSIKLICAAETPKN